MFSIRNTRKQDLEDIYELSQIEDLINLPNNRSTLNTMLQRSEQSFKNPDKKKEKNYYIFVLEDLTKNKVIGVSIIHGKHGTESEPHFFFRIYQEKKVSLSLNKTTTHKILELDYEPNGYTEIGGLILHPNYRSRKDKLGKQLAYSRFLYMALKPHLFTEIIHTELLPPLDEIHPPALWKAIGEKFTNMTYDEAHQLSLKNKEFISSLFPWQEKIYCSLLPKEAQESIGQINQNTRPVKAMLKKIGFQYTGEVDPFDGGPHYRCRREKILPIKQAQQGVIKFTKNENSHQPYLVNVKKEDLDFYCLKLDGIIDNQKLLIKSEVAKKYNISEGIEILFAPL